MQKKNNNKFRLLCVGVVAFSAVAIILFVALGGGQGVENVATQEGFNANLPTADMESVTEDRILAARLEDQRRKKEEMQGISGSTFRLLEIEEKEKTETVTDSAFYSDIVLSEAKSLIDEKLDETRINEEISNTLQQDAGGYSPSDGLAKVNAINEELKNKRKEKYKQMQQIYGTDLLPDMQEEQEQQQKKQAMTTPVETATPAPKKKKGFNTLNSGDSYEQRDVKAVVHGTHKDLTDNSMVKLRLLDAITIDGVKIPRNSFVYGKVSFASARMQITIDNINYKNKVLPFKAEIYDHDGSKGIHVPDNAINDAVKDGGSNTVNSVSTSVAAPGVIGQLASKMANNITGSVKDAVDKKINKNKVTVSDNYLVTIKMTK